MTEGRCIVGRYVGEKISQFGSIVTLDGKCSTGGCGWFKKLCISVTEGLDISLESADFAVRERCDFATIYLDRFFGYGHAIFNCCCLDYGKFLVV